MQHARRQPSPASNGAAPPRRDLGAVWELIPNASGSGAGAAPPRRDLGAVWELIANATRSGEAASWSDDPEAPLARLDRRTTRHPSSPPPLG